MTDREHRMHKLDNGSETARWAAQRIRELEAALPMLADERRRADRAEGRIRELYAEIDRAKQERSAARVKYEQPMML